VLRCNLSQRQQEIWDDEKSTHLARKQKQPQNNMHVCKEAHRISEINMHPPLRLQMESTLSCFLLILNLSVSRFHNKGKNN